MSRQARETPESTFSLVQDVTARLPRLITAQHPSVGVEEVQQLLNRLKRSEWVALHDVYPKLARRILENLRSMSNPRRLGPNHSNVRLLETTSQIALLKVIRAPQVYEFYFKFREEDLPQLVRSCYSRSSTRILTRAHLKATEKCPALP